MARLLVTLWLGTTIVAAIIMAARGQLKNLSDLQQKALDHSLGRFHESRDIINGFKVLSVQEATETKFSAGTFVRLQFTMKQTRCNKKNRESADCQVMPKGREMNCCVCYKYDAEYEMLGLPFVDCLRVQHLQKDREGQRAKACKAIEQKDEGGRDFPGVFSFSRSHA